MIARKIQGRMKYFFGHSGTEAKTGGLKALGYKNLLLILFGIITCSTLFPSCPVLASEAPLDTLNVDTLPLPAADPRYEGANIPISRKLLPEAQATTVPKTKTPKRPPRMDDPMAARWHEHLARQASLQGNTQSQQEHQAAASQAAPENPRYLWPEALGALTRVDIPVFLAKFPQAVALQLQNPVYRGPIVVAGFQGALLLLGIFWSVLVAGLTITWWRHLAHDLSALLLRGTNHRSALWLPILLPLVFLLFRPGWFGFLALMSIPLLIQTRGNSRRLLSITWVCAILLAVPMWPVLKNAIPTIDPASEANLLVKSTTLNSSSELRNELKQHLKTAKESQRINRLRVALGIQEARRGRYQTSSKLFAKVLAVESTNLPAMVGVANNMYYLGRLDKAADLFHQASLSHPQNGLILHNQAQVFFKKLFIPEAADALEKSRDLGYHPPIWQNQKLSNKTYSSVVYPGLTNANLQEACSWESGNYEVGITLMAWDTTLGSPPIPLFLLLAIPLLMACILVLFWSHQHDPRACENCGVTICGDCCGVRQESWLCNECEGIVDRARSDMILATLLKNRSRSQGMSFASSLVHQSRLFPGAGYLAVGKIFNAWIRLNMVTWGAFLVLMAWSFSAPGSWLSPGLLLSQETIHPIWVPLPVALWEGWLTPVGLVGAGLIIAAWLLALFDGTQIRHQIPEHFSLALSSTRPNQEVTESQSVSVS